MFQARNLAGSRKAPTVSGISPSVGVPDLLYLTKFPGMVTVPHGPGDKSPALRRESSLFQDFQASWVRQAHRRRLVLKEGRKGWTLP